MGSSSGIESRDCIGLTPRMLVLALLILMRTCCAVAGDYVAAAPSFKVANNLRQGALTVLHPPGCCSPCGPIASPPDVVCPAICVQCGDVVVQGGTVAMLDVHVGPYPLPYLQIQVQEKVYCVEGSDLKLIKAWVTLAIGPGACGPYNGGLAAFVSVRGMKTEHAHPLCLHVCHRD